MEAQPRREVVVAVGVVHAMDPPEQRNAVQEVMLDVAARVHRDQRDGHGKPERSLPDVEQPDAALHTDEGNADPEQRKEQAQ